MINKRRKWSRRQRWANDTHLCEFTKAAETNHPPWASSEKGRPAKRPRKIECVRLLCRLTIYSHHIFYFTAWELADCINHRAWSQTYVALLPLHLPRLAARALFTF